MRISSAWRMRRTGLRADDEKREEEQAAAVAWLKAKRDEIGLAALAKTLGMDAANLGKVIEGKRNLPRDIFLKIGTEGT